MFTLPRLAARLQSLLASLPAAVAAAPRLCVALSGGLDSTVLLVALARLRTGTAPFRQLRAVHVDHGMHPDSARWGAACRALSREFGVTHSEIRVDVRLDAGTSPEAAARSARYAALAGQLAADEVLLTAHHADDQLETILLQCLRGGGLRAVAGMAPIGPFGAAAWHARPLLEVTRDELLAWAAAQGLRWLEDPSNADRRFDRNYLRHEVLPALRSRWPAAAATFGRVAGYAHDALALEAACVETDLAGALAGCALRLDTLARLPEPRRRTVLRAWLAGLGLPPPSARTLAGLQHDMAAAAPDRLPEVRWPGAVVRRYRNHLYAAPSDAASSVVHEGEWSPRVDAGYRWSAASTLTLSRATGVGLSRERLPISLALRRRRGGEAFMPSGSAHRRDLRKWLQEHDVLPWRRPGLPLLFADGQLVAVADLGVAAGFAARSDEPSWRIEWSGRADVTAADVRASKWPLHPPIR